MDYINFLQFDFWRSEFVLTACWTPFGRHVQFVGGEKGKAALLGYFVVTDAERPDAEPGWESPATGGTPESYLWAKARNDEEIGRAWEQFQQLTEAALHLRLSCATETRIRFLESVLNLFLGWYTRVGFAFPLGPAGPPDTVGAEVKPAEREGHRQAHYAYDHIDHEDTLKGLYRRMKGGSSDGFEAFRQALVRAGFYRASGDRASKEKYREMATRVKVYVETGRRPDDAG